MFTKVCDFGWMIEGFEIGHLKGQNQGEHKLHLVPIIFEYEDIDIYNNHGLNYATIAHLQSLGLIRFGDDHDFSWYGFPKNTTLFYFDRPYNLSLEEPNYNKKWYSISVGLVLLTRAGYELARVCERKPVDGFYEYAVARWEKMRLAEEKMRLEKKKRELPKP